LRMDALVNRIARAHGFKQSGRLIRERVELVANALFPAVADPDGLVFVWPNWAAVETWSRARVPASEADIRFIDDIPHAELSALARRVSNPDPVVEIARQFGVRRVSAAARARIETAVASATEA
jgi:hypothetical protein